MRGNPEQFMLMVRLNGKLTRGLLDIGCGRTLMHKVPGLETGKRLTLKCFYGDIEDYPTKIIRVEIGQQCFFC